jgi:BTB/POZ domain
MLNRSPVFRAMLTAGMKEQASGRIELQNMKLKTGRDLLYYLYNQRLKAVLRISNPTLLI